MNLYSIGIEIIGIGSQEDMQLYLTPEEYARYQANAARAAEEYDFRRLTQKLLDVINA
jgi:hypothetical protein